MKEQSLKPISAMTPAAINREICEREGICWHESQYEWDHCPKPHYGGWPNPDFYAHPVELLKVMKGRKDWPEFLGYLWKINSSPLPDMSWTRGMLHNVLTMLTTPGLLAKARLAWLRERGKA